MDPETVLSDLREFCAERLWVELAADCIDLARPGFVLTPAEPGKEAGHSRFGGRALLEPGTPWPTCEGFPLSLLAVLDTDALSPWLGDLLPAGTGLLNFFYLDSESEQSDDDACDLAMKYHSYDPHVGRVIAARSADAVETPPPTRSSVFAPVTWSASPGVSFPDAHDSVWETLDLNPEAHDMDLYDVADQLAKWPGSSGAFYARDIAFGWPLLPSGAPLALPQYEVPIYHHLLQLSGHGPYEWGIEGDGGWMHWSIPTKALKAGDFGQAIPAPDIW
ncbi:DUF1963 domain-containing protein [Nonomuraea purpurea]|uniref:DUF1963 domain-containing protein n=1 Tax=Nonomuraea purpurea TaxID=1849276 RepID=A0ABV8G9D7_9ACTN